MRAPRVALSAYLVDTTNMTKRLRAGVDIHQIGARQTGNETYIVNILSALAAGSPEDLELFLYHTTNTPPSTWIATYRRVRPHNSLLRIPFGFPLSLRRDHLDVAQFQYVVPPVCPCPAVVVVHDISFEDHPEYFAPLQRTRLRISTPLSIARSAAVLTISEYSRQQIVKRYNVAADRVFVTRGAASSEFYPIPREQQNARLGALDLPERFVLAVGNVQPRKNLERLVAAYSKVRRGGIDLPPMVLVGQSHFRGEEIIGRILSSAESGLIRHTGYVSTEQLAALYSRAEAFFYPSLYEGFGLPILEAMACGTPVLAGNNTSMPEVAGGAAELVDSHDEASIAEGIARIMSDSSRRAQLGARGIARAAEFSWRTAAETTLSVWRDIAKQR